MAAETSGAVIKLLDCGVEHRDVRPPNVLWNSEGRKVMLVDFERSEILKQMPILQEMSPNRKRKHLHPTDKALCGGGPLPTSHGSLAIESKILADLQEAAGSYASSYSVCLRGP